MLGLLPNSNCDFSVFSARNFLDSDLTLHELGGTQLHRARNLAGAGDLRRGGLRPFQGSTECREKDKEMTLSRANKRFLMHVKSRCTRAERAILVIAEHQLGDGRELHI
jgi:hypothetical protein